MFLEIYVPPYNVFVMNDLYEYCNNNFFIVINLLIN